MSIESPHRIAKADRLQSSIYGPRVSLDRPPYITPRRPETEPIERFSDEQFGFLIDKLLEDWDSPTLSELGLCRAHSITLEELDTITDDEDFQRALALVRRVRAKRQHEREASARAALHDRLLRLIYQITDTTTDAKEVRLACKQLESFMQKNPVHAHDESANRGVPLPRGADLQSAISVTPPMQSADSSSSSPSPTSSPAGGVAGEVSSQSDDGGGNLVKPNAAPLPSGGVGAAAPTPQKRTQPTSATATPNPHKPKSPRGYKSRPKPQSR